VCLLQLYGPDVAGQVQQAGPRGSIRTMRKMNRTKKGYNKVPTHDFDASRTYASAEEVPVPQELVDFDPQVANTP